MIYENYIRVLYIDMEAQKVRIEEREDLIPYLGGVGVASRLLEENMRPDLEPLAPEQPIVLAIGALSTIFPVITKVVAMFVSPLTGTLGESYAGGRLALSLFETGFDAVVITGRAKSPLYLTITDNDVLFRNARALWKTNRDDAGRIIRDYEPSSRGKRSIIRIGEAGENQVAYACVTVDRYRHFGRMGLGAVFGSKLLKAINIAGDRSIPIRNFKNYFSVYRELYAKSTEPGGLMSKYHDAGTPINIEPLSALGGLPTRNLQAGSVDYAEQISGDAFAENDMIRKLACIGCPVGCIHIGQIRRAFADHGYEYETVAVGYDYELIFALGTFLGLDNRQDILSLIHEVEVCGHDAMSVGVVLGWATEAYANGLINADQHTLVPLAFGNVEGYKKAVHHIAAAKNDFYVALGKGVKYAASVYGGEDYACQLGGNEMPGYHTGYGSLVGVAVAARHSHLCNGGYSIDQAMQPGEVPVPAEMAQKLFDEEVERCMLNSLTICLFARKIYNRENVKKAFAAIENPLTDEELTAAARRIYATKLRIKQAFGFDWNEIKIPKRFFETPAARGKLNEETANEIIKEFAALATQVLEAEE